MERKRYRFSRHGTAVLAAALLSWAGTAQAQLITNGMPSDNVLGQPNLTSYAEAVTANGLDHPGDLAYDGAGQRLFVADSVNNRIMVYDLASGWTNGMAAAKVLGQPDFVTSGADTQNGGFGCNTAINACGLDSPGSVLYDGAGQRLFVADVANHRVLVYDLSGGITNGMPATKVLGQPDMTTGTSNTQNNGFGCNTAINACGLWFPFGLTYDPASQALYVVDLFNSRVLKHDLSGGITNGMPAVNVLGQPGFTTRNQNDLDPSMCSPPSCPTTATGMLFPNSALLLPGNQLLVSDGAYNYRVLVFDLSGGIVNHMAASKALGQPDLVTGLDSPDTICGGGGNTPNPCGIGFPGNLEFDAAGNTLFVSDDSNHRVMIFDLSGGITTGMAASKVLGHADLNTGEGYVFDPPFYGGEQYQNATYGCNGSPNACGLDGPGGLAFDPLRKVLFVSDFNANRVLVYGANMGGVTVSTTGATSIITITNGDGSKTFTLTDSLGAVHTVTLPAGTTALSPSTTINFTVVASATAPSLKVDATLPGATFKTLSVPRGTGNRLCVRDIPGATIGGTCTLANQTTIPAAGACCTGQAAGCPRLAVGQTICTSGDNSSVSVDRLVNTVLFVFNDADNDDSPDDADHCPGTNLSGPIPSVTLRPNHLGDDQTLLGCNASQILACKPGQNEGERKFGLTPGSQSIFQSKTTSPVGWANQCLQLYPNP